MFEKMTIQSHKGPYDVTLCGNLHQALEGATEGDVHCIVDANVARLYKDVLEKVLSKPTTIIIETTEASKSIDRIIPVIERLVQNGVRRNQFLVAIGGGVIQDITCFVASVLLRGISWRFLPTTLLAQADSCIGSKSSINLGSTKNILGTFCPPRDIYIHTGFLETLEKKEIHSGVGEMIKVHAIAGIEVFDSFVSDFDQMFDNRDVLVRRIRESLLVKKRYVEADEFDRDIRNIFNYGHSFGHAIESATQYNIPHGIAVSMGMDMANSIAVKQNILPQKHFDRMHDVLQKNYRAYSGTTIPLSNMLEALLKDKKNTSTKLGLIFPVGADAQIQKVYIPLDDRFKLQCEEFLSNLT